ncbi:hypothetical protein [Bdellovibrio reynosensis]|uniref:Transglycosylase SLT domain-containing protein n=1 Tax=Bdellovibrio reynosensis TaxID=2835041 RepID=A0ABY4CAP5_9BACT|nr:hypothetical protein [Bdellovibrio reynosensis]UOF01544.1 hypothetical protein MNR06_01070 [Bdellovibrio reynosensis]
MNKSKLLTSFIAVSLVIGYSHAALAMAKAPVKEEKPPAATSPKPPSATPAPKPPASGEKREVTPLWETAHKDGKEWTAHVDRQLETLGQDLLDVIPADYATFCPKYKDLSYKERKEFWTYLISQMVRYESNFKTGTSYKEDFSDSTGANVMSRGLLQISIESGNAYGCNFKSSKDIHDPYQNLSCGIRILDRWVERDGRIAGKVSGKWRGGARYWSVLRSTSGSISKIVTATKKINLCK